MQKCVGMVVRCEECLKWRVFYSKHVLTTVHRVVLQCIIGELSHVAANFKTLKMQQIIFLNKSL